MAGQYRISRNIEASIIDYLTDELTGSWTGIQIEKSFARIYDISLPSVCIRVGATSHDKAEIGTDATIRTPQVLIDLFAQSDGQRLDLKDFIISTIKSGIPYYEYEIENGTVKTKTANGRIRILSIDEVNINFDSAKNELDVHDRFRHNISLEVSLGRVEN